MSVVKTVVGRPVTFLVIFVLLTVVGIYALFRISVDFLPEIEFPVITVISLYDGSPREIEKSITEFIEGALANLADVKRITSTIESGSSSTTIEFAYGTDLDGAAADIRTNLGLVEPALPSGVTTQILMLNTANAPVVVFQISGKRSLSEIFRQADEVAKPMFERLSGVARVFLLGAADPVLRVEVPQERLGAYSLSLPSISQQLNRNNAEVLGGKITDSGREYLVEASGAFEDVDAVKNSIIAYRGTIANGQKIIRVQDIADVYFDNEVSSSNEVYVDGDPSLYLAIQKQSQANTVQVSDAIDKAFPAILSQLPPDMSFNVVFNTADSIRNSLSAVSQNALWGMILAISVLYIFLRSIRATLVISISIPVSVVVTVLVMYFLDLSLNLITLAGLALGVGMLVDNSIIILENIYRYRNRGVTLVSSAILGGKEMITPMMSSTLTSTCVFIPLLMFKSDLGLVGELFLPLALTVVIALLTSLAVAIFLVPILASHYLRIPLSTISDNKKGFLHTLNRGIEHILQKLENAYKSAIRALLKHRYLSLLGLIVALVLIVVLLPIPPFEMFPRIEGNEVAVGVELPPGTNVEVTKSVLFNLEEYVRERYNDDINIVSVEIGKSIRGPGVNAMQGNIGTITLYLKDVTDRSVTATELRQALREQIQTFPSVKAKMNTGGGSGPSGALSSDAAISISVSGSNYDLLHSTGERIQSIMDTMGLEDTLLDVSEPMPEVNIIINRQRAYTLGVGIDTIGAEIRAVLNGVKTGTIELNGDDYDIVLSLPDQNTDELIDLTRLFVTSSSGQKVSLSNLVSFGYGTSVQAIERENQKRILNVTANVAEGVNVSDAMPELQQLIREQIPYKEGVTIEYGGSYEDFMENVVTFVLFGVLAILFIYGIMASLFESFLDPFIILFTIPLTVVGVLVIYALTGESISSFTAIGLIMLFGIIVNNGIVLVDYTNLLRRRGMELLEACMEAGKARLRPILMTTMTTVFGMIPIAFVSGGEGTELIQSIAKTIVGGLTGGVFFTLFLMPILYAVFNVWSEKFHISHDRRVKKKEVEILKAYKASKTTTG